MYTHPPPRRRGGAAFFSSTFEREGGREPRHVAGCCWARCLLRRRVWKERPAATFWTAETKPVVVVVFFDEGRVECRVGDEGGDSSTLRDVRMRTTWRWDGAAVETSGFEATITLSGTPARRANLTRAAAPRAVGATRRETASRLVTAQASGKKSRPRVQLCWSLAPRISRTWVGSQKSTTASQESTWDPSLKMPTIERIAVDAEFAPTLRWIGSKARSARSAARA
mmetsp:Transcript_8006/g.20775  ORF Transcript_8006/g.20775 Transcript_8006/m.20775 type:complete len:226 (-) Transcript_8006:89-766(-)